MKKNIIKIHLAIAALFMMFSSCEKTAVEDITRPYSGAEFKFYNFATGAPAVHFYANGVKSTATLSASGSESASGVNYGSLLPARGYDLTVAGTGVSFTAVTPSKQVANATTGAGPSYTIATVVKDVENGKHYSFFTSGAYNVATKTSDAFIIEDVLPAADTTQSYIRLVNPGHTTSTLSFELTSVASATSPAVTTTPITGVAYKSGSAFVAVKSGSYTLKVIDATTGKVVSRGSTSLVKERVYTFTLRGNLISGSPAAFIDFTENR